jgi:uncharacterized membrane protein
MALALIVVAVLAVVALVQSYKLDEELRRLGLQLDDLRSELDRLKRLASPAQRPAQAPPAEAPPPRPAPAPAPIVTPTPAAPIRPPAPMPSPVAPPLRPARIPAPASTMSAAPAILAGAPEAHDASMDAWETRIGGSWLNRIGVVLLVIGIASALGYSFTRLGPSGKAALATAVSLALIAGGVLLERRERYTFYGRGLIGGGWAALYATAYAVHELEATRVVESPFLGFALLLLVGVGMIVHSLRYANQGLTALAYGLAYGSIVLHSIRPYTLAAAALLAVGTVLHLLRRRWYAMSIGGIVATYGCLFLWASRQAVLTGEVMLWGMGALFIDWVVFLVPDFAREPEGDEERLAALESAGLNALAAGCLSYVFWIKAYPSEGFRPLLAFGGAYVVTAAVLWIVRRRTVQPVHALAATLLLAIAFHKGLDRTAATWAWLVEAQAVVLVGVFLKDRFHRRLGCVLFLAPMVAIIYDQFDARLASRHGALDPVRLAQTLVACGFFYLTFARLKPFASEEALRRIFSYAAFLLILLAMFVQFPAVWVAPAGALLLLILFELSAARPIPDLRAQAHLSAVYAAAMGLGLSARSHDTVAGLEARIPALIVVAAAYAAVFLRRRKGGAVCLMGADEVPQGVYSWAGAAALVLVVWFAVRLTLVGPGWMILAVALVEAGAALREIELRRPGYATALAATVATLALSAPSHEPLARIAVRTPALLSVSALFLWLFLRQRGARARTFDELDHGLRPLFAWAGTILAALLVWLEARPTLVGPLWIILALLLAEAGIALREPHLRLPGYLVLVAAHVSLVMSNLTATGIAGGLSVRALTLVPAIAATYYLWWRLRSLPQTGASRAGDARDENFGRLTTYLGGAMVGLFVRFEFGLEGAALRWSLAMLGLLVAGHLLRDADLRLQGYLLAAAVFVRAVGFDFRGDGRILGVDGPFLIAITGVVCYLASGFLIRARSASVTPSDRRSLALESVLEKHGQPAMWLLTVGLAALYLFRTLSGVSLIVAWAIEGLAAAGAGFSLGARSFRLSGLGLLAVCIVMALVRAFTTFDMPGRIVTFLVLGVILLLISFGYTRYRETLRKVL